MADGYKSTEASLVGEIFALEEKLKEQSKSDNHDNSFDTLSVELGSDNFLLKDGEGEGSGGLGAVEANEDAGKRPESRSVCHSIFGRDDLDDLTRSLAGNNADGDLPSPSIQETHDAPDTEDTQTTQLLAESLLFDSEDVVPATQFSDESDVIHGGTTAASSKLETRTDTEKEREGVVGRTRGRKVSEREDAERRLLASSDEETNGKEEEEEGNRAKRRKLGMEKESGSGVRNGTGEGTVSTDEESTPSVEDALENVGKGKGKGRGKNQKVTPAGDSGGRQSDDDDDDDKTGRSKKKLAHKKFGDKSPSL